MRCLISGGKIVKLLHEQSNFCKLINCSIYGGNVVNSLYEQSNIHKLFN